MLIQTKYHDNSTRGFRIVTWRQRRIDRHNESEDAHFCTFWCEFAENKDAELIIQKFLPSEIFKGIHFSFIHIISPCCNANITYKEGQWSEILPRESDAYHWQWIKCTQINRQSCYNGTGETTCRVRSRKGRRGVTERPCPYIPDIYNCISPDPITIATRSKGWTVFVRSNTRNMGSNITWGMDVCVRLFCVCAVLCV
jgi:hypothetical protein